MNFAVFIFIVLTFSAEGNNIIEDVNEDNSNIGKEIAFRRLRPIFPKTKYCGMGNISVNGELGKYKEVDRCCKIHDACPDIIRARRTKYNLKNKAFHTRLSCDCDNAFHNCLIEAKPNFVSLMIGTIYFNMIGTKCFKKEYPIKRCSKMLDYVLRRNKCTEYELDTSQDKVYQFFDVPCYGNTTAYCSILSL